jgi:hypothetical protein
MGACVSTRKYEVKLVRKGEVVPGRIVLHCTGNLVELRFPPTCDDQDETFCEDYRRAWAALSERSESFSLVLDFQATTCFMCDLTELVSSHTSLVML